MLYGYIGKYQETLSSLSYCLRCKAGQEEVTRCHRKKVYVWIIGNRQTSQYLVKDTQRKKEDVHQ